MMARSLQPGIRPADSADMPAVLALLEGAGLPTTDLAGIPRLHIWVLHAMNSLPGVIALERFGSDALLRSLAVAAGCRGRGFGHQLVALLEREAQAQGVERLILLTLTAETFFRSLGYDTIERRSVSEEMRQSAQFRSLCPASAVCMGKSLR